MNFAALRAPPRENVPRVCVFQNADPAEPMNPFELLVAYEEHGRVMPVVSGKSSDVKREKITCVVR